jgi:hypothetical protein
MPRAVWKGLGSAFVGVEMQILGVGSVSVLKSPIPSLAAVGLFSAEISWHAKIPQAFHSSIYMSKVALLVSEFHRV